MASGNDVLSNSSYFDISNVKTSACTNERCLSMFTAKIIHSWSSVQPDILADRQG